MRLNIYQVYFCFLRDTIAPPYCLLMNFNDFIYILFICVILILKGIIKNKKLKLDILNDRHKNKYENNRLQYGQDINTINMNRKFY